MESYFDIQLTDDQLRAISSIGLAHMGDAVFEILVRTWLCAHGKATGIQTGAQRPGPYCARSCQPCPVRRGHGAGGPAGLAVAEGTERPDRPAV